MEERGGLSYAEDDGCSEHAEYSALRENSEKYQACCDAVEDSESYVGGWIPVVCHAGDEEREEYDCPDAFPPLVSPLCCREFEAAPYKEQEEDCGHTCEKPPACAERIDRIVQEVVQIVHSVVEHHHADGQRAQQINFYETGRRVHFRSLMVLPAKVNGSWASAAQCFLRAARVRWCAGEGGTGRAWQGSSSFRRVTQGGAGTQGR